MNKVSNLSDRIYKIVKKINKALISISAVTILVLNAIVFYDVIMRYIFNSPTLWGIEISTYLLLLITFLSTGYTMQIDGHVSCNILVSKVKPRVRRIFFLVVSPFGLMFCVVLGWQACRLFLMAYQEKWVSSFALSIPLKYPYFLLPTGLFLLILTYLLRTTLVLLNPGKEVSTETDRI